MSVIRTCGIRATVTRSAVSRVSFYDNNAAVIGITAITPMRRDSRQPADISHIFAIECTIASRSGNAFVAAVRSSFSLSLARKRNVAALLPSQESSQRSIMLEMTRRFSQSIDELNTCIEFKGSPHPRVPDRIGNGSRLGPRTLRELGAADQTRERSFRIAECVTRPDYLLSNAADQVAIG